MAWERGVWCLCEMRRRRRALFGVMVVILWFMQVLRFGDAYCLLRSKSLNVATRVRDWQRWAKPKHKPLISSDLLDKIGVLKNEEIQSLQVEEQVGSRTRKHPTGASRQSLVSAADCISTLHQETALPPTPLDASIPTLSSTPSRKKQPSSTRIRLGESVQPTFVQLLGKEIAIQFAGETLIRNATIQVSTGDRVGLVGHNGSGKTTLLRTLCGEVTSDTGLISTTPSDIRIAFLRQEFIDSLRGNNTLQDEVLSSFEEELSLLGEIRQLEGLLTTHTHEEKESAQQWQTQFDRLQALNEQAKLLGAFQLAHKAEKAIGLMGFAESDRLRRVDEFSGGWKMKIALAKILCSEPHMLFLDEPTNHMDLESVVWLEGFLKQRNVPMIVVSHDREFLDQVCNRIVDIEDGALVNYQGNYCQFLSQRAIRWQTWRDKYEQQQKHVQETQKWIRQAKNDPASAHLVKSREAALDKFVNSADYLTAPPKDRKFRFRFESLSRNADVVIEAVNVRHGYGQGAYSTLFKDINVEVCKGDRVGLIGPNGAGKSTFLRLLAGEENPLQGHIQSGNTRINYYSQHQADTLNLEETVLESVESVASSTVTPVDLRNLLAKFLFKGEAINKRIRLLSGGEKARVALCRLMLQPASLLLLDEPTNHLDITAKEVLEEALQHFAGTVVFVSHDRYFLSQVANSILEFKDQGVIKYEGDYYSYLHQGESSLKDRLDSRSIDGDRYHISNAKPVLAKFEDVINRRKNFGGSGLPSGNAKKGFKNAKRYQ